MHPFRNRSLVLRKPGEPEVGEKPYESGNVDENSTAQPKEDTSTMMATTVENRGEEMVVGEEEDDVIIDV